MYLRYLFAISLVIFLCDGNNNTSKTSNITAMSNFTTLKAQNTTNETKAEMLSEGGFVITNILPITLPSENHTNLITLDKEIGKTKEKSIVPRKGVVYNPVESSAMNKNNSKKDRIDTTEVKPKTGNGKPNTLKDSQTNSSMLTHYINVTGKSEQKSSLNESITTSTNPLSHKKPLIVSYEALSEKDKNAKSETLMMPQVVSSSKPVVSDQLPTPNVKIHPMSTNRHPGMVMPIVITILVVPMFAVLGYMALRRGQEAWKNRHYKRMDFLLDGMYND